MTYPEGLKVLHGKWIAILQISTFALVPQSAHVLKNPMQLYVVRNFPTDPDLEVDRFLLAEIDAKIVRHFRGRCKMLSDNPKRSIPGLVILILLASVRWKQG